MLYFLSALYEPMSVRWKLEGQCLSLTVDEKGFSNFQTMKRVFLPSLFPASILLQSYANLIFSHHLHTQSISKSSYLTPNTPQTIPVLFYRNKPMFEPPRFPPKLLSLIISIGELIYPIWKLAGFKNEVSDSFVDHDGYSISSKGVLPAVVYIMVIWVKFTHSSPF